MGACRAVVCTCVITHWALGPEDPDARTPDRALCMGASSRRGLPVTCTCTCTLGEEGGGPQPGLTCTAPSLGCPALHPVWVALHAPHPHLNLSHCSTTLLPPSCYLRQLTTGNFSGCLLFTYRPCQPTTTPSFSSSRCSPGTRPSLARSAPSYLTTQNCSRPAVGPTSHNPSNTDQPQTSSSPFQNIHHASERIQISPA